MKLFLIFASITLVFIIAIKILSDNQSYLMNLGYTPSEAKYEQGGYIFIIGVVCYLIYIIYKKIKHK